MIGNCDRFDLLGLVGKDDILMQHRHLIFAHPTYLLPITYEQLTKLFPTNQ